MKRLASLLLSLALLVGCSTATPKQEKPVDLVLYLGFSINREAVDEWVEIYEQKHPNVKVKVKELRTPHFRDQDGKVIPSIFEGGDLAILPYHLLRQMHSEGLLRDLSSTRLPAFDPMVAGIVEELSKADGKRFGLPLSVQPAMFILNTPTFKNAGLEPPPVDWTVDEFEQTLAQLKEAGAEPLLFVEWMAQPIIGSFGGRLYDPAEQQWVFDSPETRQALVFLGRMVKAGLLMTQNESDRVRVEVGPDPALIQMLPRTIGLPATGPGVQLQPFPKGPGGRSVPTSANLGAILSSSANPEVAADFLREMLSNPEAQQALARSGVRPIVPDAKAMAIWRESVGDRTADAVELSLQNAYADFDFNSYGFMRDMGPYFKGIASLEQTIASLKAKYK